jgi:acyl-coenzyme A synthetase/AMP-(fatty) acid ligase
VASRQVDGEELRQWARGILAPHKVPKDFHFTDALPRNPMGKTVKPDVVRLVTERS